MPGVEILLERSFDLVGERSLRAAIEIDLLAKDRETASDRGDAQLWQGSNPHFHFGREATATEFGMSRVYEWYTRQLGGRTPAQLGSKMMYRRYTSRLFLTYRKCLR